ncbi:unnamed protein product [Owenia fusiformis]|uniref:Protein Wnt n=1 Tax=Owenia fusiformis TaxID=6347 RepID=A0A8J1UE05_OWEFU|nr:unnamed protein product [Owenia fusiformis]
MYYYRTMQKKHLYTLLMFMLLLEECYAAAGIKWLALGLSQTIPRIQDETICDKLTGLVKKQKHICRQQIEVMDSVKLGASMAIKECQFQFRNRRWNCSTVDPVSVFGTREVAFVHSISSAGVSHTVTRACSSAKLTKCGCDRTVRGRSSKGFDWAGCSDNIAYGNAFSKTFVDARERGRKGDGGRSLMNLHNNEAGRQVIDDNMRVECKCHGVSGTCELKTCWRAMPTFRTVGEKLKEKFDGATEVEQRRIGTRRQLLPKNPQFKPHTGSDLVYLVPSPDYCEMDPHTGSIGTSGRLCSKASKAIDGCDLMCCGRGFTTRVKTVTERCMCKFHWCCYVKCKECQREVEEHTCL